MGRNQGLIKTDTLTKANAYVPNSTTATEAIASTKFWFNRAMKSTGISIPATITDSQKSLQPKYGKNCLRQCFSCELSPAGARSGPDCTRPAPMVGRDPIFLGSQKRGRPMAAQFNREFGLRGPGSGPGQELLQPVRNQILHNRRISQR
jgi:hypothetical protein